MTKYGKLINGELFLAPAAYKTEDTTILNITSDEELLREYGFKEIIEAERPEYPYILSYEESENAITEIITRDTEKEAEQAAAAEAALRRQFFQTSLGYIKRTVTMKDGSQKDFLTGILPALKDKFEKGVAVSILVYAQDGQQQSKEVTEQFFNECDNQLYYDFFGHNYESEV